MYSILLILNLSSGQETNKWIWKQWLAYYHLMGILTCAKPVYFMSCNSNIFLPKTNHASTTKYFWYNKIPIYKIDFIFIKILIKGSAQDLWNQAKKNRQPTFRGTILEGKYVWWINSNCIVPLDNKWSITFCYSSKKKKGMSLVY